MIKLQANFTFDTGKNADLGVCDVRKMQEGRRSWDADGASDQLLRDSQM